MKQKVSDFCYEYNSPEDLAIIYYNENIYERIKTQGFALAA